MLDKKHFLCVFHKMKPFSIHFHAFFTVFYDILLLLK
jgi:hypothetical protein